MERLIWVLYDPERNEFYNDAWDTDCYFHIEANEEILDGVKIFETPERAIAESKWLKSENANYNFIVTQIAYDYSKSVRKDLMGGSK